VYLSPSEQYRSTQIETASPERLLILLYDGAIRSLNHARVAIDERNRQKANRSFQKAQAIITELQGVLDMSVGEIAKNLYALYDYFTRRLIEANIKQDGAIAGEVLEHLKDLRSAWKQAIVLNASTGRPVSLANVSG
jgi:flagellar protein FliS